MPRKLNEQTDDAPREFAGQVTANEMDSADSPEESTVKGRNARLYDDAALRNIASFDDAMALTTTILGAEPVDAADEIGNGFTVLPTDEKARLVGVPFIILSVDFAQGNNGPYASTMIVTKEGERLILNDGSTGIYAQLDEWCVKSSRVGGLMVAGLRRSEYKRSDPEAMRVKAESGTVLRGVTFYLNV